jgi:hypothetical protein
LQDRQKGAGAGDELSLSSCSSGRVRFSGFQSQEETEAEAETMRQAWELAEPMESPLSESQGWELPQPLSPSGTPIADVVQMATDVTAFNQAAIEDAFDSPGVRTRPAGFLLPFIIGFGAAWIARQWKVI